MSAEKLVAARPFTRTAVHLGGVVTALLVSGTGSLLVAEVLVRLILPQQLILIRPDLWRPADTVGWLHRPNAAVSINTGERSVTVYTDERGFRVGKDGRHQGSTRVLLLGDSFMEALQVEHEQTVAHLLEEGLTRRLARPVVVDNAGVVGWDPNHYLLWTRAMVRQDSFALVVVALFVGNDVVYGRTDYISPRAPVERKRFRSLRGLNSRELVDAVLAPANDFLEVRSQLFILLKNQLSLMRMRFGLTAEYFPQEYRRAEAESPRWRLTGEVARDLAEAARKRGAPTLFVLIPASFQVYERDFHDYVNGFRIDPTTVDIDQPSRLLHEALGSFGLTVVDALPGFRAAASAGARLFGAVDQHLSPAGHALLADIVGPQAARQLER